MLPPNASVAFLLALLAPFGAAAATIAVDTTADEIVDDGRCSLREAISATTLGEPVDACAVGEGADEIVLGPGTFTLALGAFDIHDTLTIRGAGAGETVIDGDCLDRHFNVAEGGELRLIDVSLQNGCPTTLADDGTGAPGGAILSKGSLEIEGCTLSGNRAGAGDAGKAGGSGGAIFATGPTTISDSLVQANVSGNGGESSTGYVGPGSGGAIYSVGPLVVQRSRITGNHLGAARTGGVVRPSFGVGAAIASEGPLTLRDVALSQNGLSGVRADQGTVWAANPSIARTSFEGNRAHRGSALYSAGAGSLLNVTVVGNEALGPSGGNPGGGAIHAESGLLSIDSSTFTGNAGGALAIPSAMGSSIWIRNSIVAGNRATAGPSTPLDCTGVTTAIIPVLGPNLYSPGGGCDPGSRGIVTDDLGLDPLSTDDNTTAAFLPLQPGSPGVDAGDCQALPEMFRSPVDEDIRRVPRPQGAACDIGAFEYVEPRLLSRVSDEAPGEACEEGGVRVELGMDDDSNLVLDDEEVETVALVCHGVDGAPGSSCGVAEGENGEVVIRCDDGTEISIPSRRGSLLRIEDVPSGEMCLAGGRRVLAGVDRNGDGVLGPDEIESEAMICHGEDGRDGESGGAGPSCTVAKTSKGGAKVSCPDGSTVTIAAPAESGGCAAGGGAASTIGLLVGAWALRRAWPLNRHRVGPDQQGRR